MIIRDCLLFKYQLSSNVIDDIRNTTNGNFVLGAGKFKRKIGQVHGRRVEPGKSGRPKMLINRDSLF